MEQSKRNGGAADAMSGILTGADAHNRLVIIEQKLDAIIDFLGMTRHWPVHGAQETVPGHTSSNGAEEPYMVFRNFTFENQSQHAPHKVATESDTFGNVDYTPRPHSAAAVHDYGNGSIFSSTSQPQSQGRVTPSTHSAKERHGIPPRHANVFSGRVTSNSSSGDFFEFTDSVASSARSSRDGCQDSVNTGKQSTGSISVTIYAEDMQGTKESAEATGADSVSGESNKNEGGRSSRSGVYKDHKSSQRKVQDARNKGQKAGWKDVAPTLADHGGSTVSLDSCTTTSVKSTEGPISKQESAKCRTSRSCSGAASSRSMAGGSKSRRDLMRTASARDNHSTQSVRAPKAVKKQDTCSNAEVVRQIKEKIMEIRQKDGAEKKTCDAPTVPRAQRVRSSLKYYGRVDMGRVAWHA